MKTPTPTRPVFSRFASHGFIRFYVQTATGRTQIGSVSCACTVKQANESEQLAQARWLASTH